MENEQTRQYDQTDTSPWDGSGIYIAEVVSEPPQRAPYHDRVAHRRIGLPLALFVLTCISTYTAGGLTYALALMTILICHEAGHFIQARRYRVYASLPYFIPMPITPIGTMGAVIGMEARVGDRKALFDIGITGPLAGLVPTVLCCIIGLSLSQFVPERLVHASDGMSIGEPYLMTWMINHTIGAPPRGYEVLLHPIAYAGWVGLLITSLNLFPIGQLDGGHILYGLLRRKAHYVAWALLLAAGATIFLAAYWFHQFELMNWLVMIGLLLAMGPRHPQTADDNVPLGAGRMILGWLTLAFLPIGFTPIPFIIH